jgi:hypothetical protein
LENSNEQKIRWFEAEVLDKVYLKTPFLEFDEDIVIPYLLKAFGDIERDKAIFKNKGISDMSISTHLTMILHAIGHGIRWIYQVENPNPVRQIANHLEADKLSAELLTAAFDYYKVSIQFVSWSRGLAIATLNEQQKTIRFDPSHLFDYQKLVFSKSQDHQLAQEFMDSLPHDVFETEFKKWFGSVDLFNPPIIGSMDWELARDSHLYPLLLEKINQTILPECSPDTELGGYRLDEYRQFYTVLSLNFLFIHWVEGVIDQIKEENPFGSNPIKMEFEEAYTFFSEITGLPCNVVEAIIEDLTFDYKNFHSTLMIQPFVKSRSSNLYILPNFFSFVDPNRMLTGALNKGKKKPVYDRLINQIEQYQLATLVTLFEKMDMEVLKERSIKVLGRIFTPDLVVVDRSSRIILIVDYKHFLSPLGPSEVHYKVTEINKAVKQVSNYVDFIPKSRVMHELTRDDIPDFSYVGMILFNNPMSVPLPVNLNILISDLYSFSQLVSGTANNLLDILAQVRSPLLSEHEDKNFDFYDEEITVADWKVTWQYYATKKLT